MQSFKLKRLVLISGETLYAKRRWKEILQVKLMRRTKKLLCDNHFRIGKYELAIPSSTPK